MIKPINLVDLSNKINIIIGDRKSGKTTLMKNILETNNIENTIVFLISNNNDYIRMVSSLHYYDKNITDNIEYICKYVKEDSDINKIIIFDDTITLFNDLLKRSDFNNILLNNKKHNLSIYLLSPHPIVLRNSYNVLVNNIIILGDKMSETFYKLTYSVYKDYFNSEADYKMILFTTTKNWKYLVLNKDDKVNRFSYGIIKKNVKEDMFLTKDINEEDNNDIELMDTVIRLNDIIDRIKKVKKQINDRLNN